MRYLTGAEACWRSAASGRLRYNPTDMVLAGLKRVCIGSNWRHTAVRGLLLAVVVYLLCSFVFLPFRVSGASMAPLYKTGDFGVINALAYTWGDPKRGDVVAIRMAGRRVMLLKRVIGEPGETVVMRGGVVYIDGRELDEPYLLYRGDWDMKPQKLEADQYLVIGDNRGMPQDQHQHGKVKRRAIAGRMGL